MKIQFLFITKENETITNSKIYDEDEELENDDICGCVVDFKDEIPMLSDYQYYVNEIWCGCLQFCTDKKLKKIDTKIFKEE
ncbi:hypothetical protein KYB31_09380 [Clostridium felsineum]|uniref:hypothetical protein n=1 Tax=Clostridium felsineum TaxID=36839 RepID=UPI00214DCC97|nr:hypothetical protein [Clostridium felsineum]MCR3759200.1 hypothetical protein [Clostridium felsineum]